jgi:hypothetical protein
LVLPLLIEGNPEITVVTFPAGVTCAMAPDELTQAGSDPLTQPAGTVFSPASETSRSPFGSTKILRGWFRPVATTCTCPALDALAVLIAWARALA